MERNIYAGVVTSKGQVTVPKPIRERLGLKQGDRIEFVAESGRTVVRRARKSANPFTKYAGVLGYSDDRLENFTKRLDVYSRPLKDSFLA